MTSPSPPPPSKKTKNKRLLSEVDAESTTARSSSSRSRQTKRRKSQAGRVSSDEEEAVEGGAKTWNDPNGIRFRTGEGGRGRERLVLVKKLMRKFDMPRDSTHPDRDVM